QAAAAGVAAVAFVADPVGIGLHAVGHPARFRKVVGKRLAGGALDHDAEPVSLGGAVVPVGAGRPFAREAPQVGQHVGLVVDAGATVHLPHVGLRIGVVLVPAHARGHGQQLADGNPGIGAVGQLRDVAGQGVIQAPDVPL